MCLDYFTGFYDGPILSMKTEAVIKERSYLNSSSCKLLFRMGIVTGNRAIFVTFFLDGSDKFQTISLLGNYSG